MSPLVLSPEHKGTFEVFSTKYGKRYARYSDEIGYTWYVYDFFTESYRNLSTLPDSGSLQESLEAAYKITPILPSNSAK